MHVLDMHIYGGTTGSVLDMMGLTAGIRAGHAWWDYGDYVVGSAKANPTVLNADFSPQRMVKCISV